MRWHGRRGPWLKVFSSISAVQLKGGLAVEIDREKIDGHVQSWAALAARDYSLDVEDRV